LPAAGRTTKLRLHNRRDFTAYGAPAALLSHYRRLSGLRHIVWQPGKVGGNIYGYDLDFFRHFEVTGGKIEDTGNTGLNEGIGYLLSSRARYGDYHNFYVSFPELLEISNILDGNVIFGFTYFFRVTVKGGNKVKTIYSKTGIGQQGRAEIADTNQCDRPGGIEFKNFADLFNEVLNFVALAAYAKAAKIREILSNL